MRTHTTIFAFLLAACSPSLPLSKTGPTDCATDDDCAVAADCRSYACGSSGQCVFTFEPGKSSTCGPFCTSSDDCGGRPCSANGLCGCEVDSDCGSTDCVASACVAGQCVQHIQHTDDCRPTAAPDCASSTDCAAMAASDPAPACYAWACIGSPGTCQQAPVAEGSPCNPAPLLCAGTCAFSSDGAATCEPVSSCGTGTGG